VVAPAPIFKSLGDGGTGSMQIGFGFFFRIVRLWSLKTLVAEDQ
jgi:hypothetical protein